MNNEKEHLGIEVMLSRLRGDEEASKAYTEAIGKTIAQVKCDKENNNLRFDFSDGTLLVVYDDGQSCCEERYMVCDDDLKPFAGSKLVSMELRDGPTTEEGDVHEVEFLIVNTSLGSFTVSNHNEHNGYYGGFYIRCSSKA